MDQNSSTKVVDVFIENHSSVFLFRPVTQLGIDWLTENTDGLWYGDALAVEHRYAMDLAQGMIDNGLIVK